MVFLGGLIQFSITNAHAPPNDCPSRYEFILIFLNNSHTALFRDNKYWGYPLTIRDKVDDPRIQQFQNLLLNYLCWLLRF